MGAILVFILVVGTSPAWAGWVAQTSGTSLLLRGVHFPVDPTTGYAVGTSGTILKTTDGGTNWSTQSSGTTNALNAVHFVDATTGYAVGRSGTVLKTTDGGTNWSTQSSGTAEDLWSVHFPVDATTGYTVGLSGTILKTTDGGTNWSSQSSGTTNNLRGVHFPSNATTGYAVGGSGTILKTIDGGTNWSPQSSGTALTLRGVHFPVDPTTGYAVGASGTIVKTADGGTNWSAQTSGTGNELASVHFPVDATTGYAVGLSGTILKTTDGGTNWSPQSSGTGNELASVHFPVDATTGYAVGLSGTILKTTDGGRPSTNYRSIGTAPDYATGTITAMAGSAVVTGTGTAWKAANRGRGDRINIEGTDYTILSVDSESQLTLTNAFGGTTGAGKSYTISRQFATLQVWEDCISAGGPCTYFPVASASLVADDRKEIGIAYQDSVFTTTSQVLIDGSTTDATHNIVLTAALGNRHNGTAGTGVVLDGLDNGSGGLRVRDDYTVVEWLELKRFRGANGIESVSVIDAANVLLSQLLIHDFDDPAFNLVGVRGAQNSEFTMRNSILYDGDDVGVRHAGAGTGPATIENCTIYGMNGVGIQNSTVAWTVRNTISMGNLSGDFDIVTGTQSNNISSDATAAGLGSLIFTVAGNQFVSLTPGSEDLHLKVGADAVDAGVDLSAQFCCDIDWELRPGGAAWDIGADEFGAVAAVGVPSISSAANQSFTVGTPLTAAANITVTDDVVAPAITAGGDIRIRIPAGFNMRWDATMVGVTLAGTALGKVLPDVVYEDLDRTVVLNVVTDFAPGDQIQIGDLQIMSFTAPSPLDNLELEITNDGSVAAVDDKLIEIVPDLTPVLSSANDQIFLLSQPPTPAATLFVTEGSMNDINTTNGTIIIRIPAAFPMLWDTSITTAIIGGTGSSNVSTTVSYEPGDRGLIVNVTTNFAPGDFISISGLGFRNFTLFASPDNLELDVGTAVDTDDKTIAVDALGDVPFFTATATNLQVELEWVTPFGTCADVRIVRRLAGDPTPFVSDWSAEVLCGGPGVKHNITDLPPLNDQTYTYGAFVHDGFGSYSGGELLKARPFDTSGRVKWAYSTAAASMAPPGLRFSGGNATVYAVSNDNILHAIQGSAGGGTWPVGWTPYRLGGPAQARPPVVPFAVGSATNGVAFLGSQDGNVYAINADDGSKTWSENIATMVQASPGGNFFAYDPLAKDVVLVGTRNSAGANALVALNVDDGVPVWSFTNLSSQGGDDTDIGIISGSVTVVYATRRLFFASRQKTGGSANTIWCIDFDSGSPNLVWAKPIGNIDGSPILWGGVVYVGTNAGSLYALDAANGDNKWAPLALGDGAIKGFVFPQFGTDNRFVSTNGNVWSIADSGAARSVNPGWPVTSVPSPSIPTYVPWSSEVFVGSGDGNLYQLDVTSPVPTLSVTLGDGGGAVGAPTVDLLNSMIYVGTDQGVIYGVEFPLP